MLVYLDTCIVIYAVEGQPAFRTRAQNHIASLQSAGHRFAITEFARLECLVKPLGIEDGGLLLDYERFFLAPDLTFVPLSAPVFGRAAQIRGNQKYANGKRYSVQDSLHLAAAVQGGCDSFVTNDLRLNGFRGIVVNVLP